MKFSPCTAVNNSSTKALRTTRSFDLPPHPDQDVPLLRSLSSGHRYTSPRDISGFSSGYTSLKDIIDQSSTSKSGCMSISDVELSLISNRLVKMAARWYLQPMPAEMGSSNKHFMVRQCWQRLSRQLKQPLRACLAFVHRHILRRITLAFDHLLLAICSGQQEAVMNTNVRDSHFCEPC